MQPRFLLFSLFIQIAVRKFVFEMVVCLAYEVPKKIYDILSAGIYLLKVNNRNTRTRCEICSKLTIRTPERRYWLHCHC